MFQLFFIVLAVLGATIHLAFSRKRRSSRLAIAETYLLYLLVIYVGVMGVVTFIFHVFFAATASASIGWAPSPFEYEVGIADLTVGVLGILCVWFRENFWLATATANAVWLLGDAVGHVRQMIEQNNHAQNNSGMFLVLEFLMPPLILVLTLYSRRSRHAAS
jgi:hypothetical protein